jgi:hypothetical protein
MSDYSGLKIRLYSVVTNKAGGEFYRTLRPFSFGVTAPLTGVVMIWSVVVDLKQILLHGKNYDWPRPEACLHCGHWRVWGHGCQSALKIDPPPASNFDPPQGVSFGRFSSF